jgi:hypothetical protein
MKSPRWKFLTFLSPLLILAGVAAIAPVRAGAPLLSPQQR